MIKSRISFFPAILISQLVCLLLFMTLGCGQPADSITDSINSTPPDPGEQNAPPDSVSSVIDNHLELLTVAEGVIGPEGGSISRDGHTFLTVPPGALAEETEIRIGLTNSPDSGQQIMGNTTIREVVICEPEGLQFAIPAVLRIPQMIAAPNAEQTVYYHNGTQWDAVGRNAVSDIVSDSSVAVEIDHFSVYGLSSLSGSGLDTFERDRGSLSRSELQNRVQDFMDGNNLMGQTRQKGEQLYRVCGVEFDIQYLVGTSEGQYTQLIGRRSDIRENLTSYFDWQTTDTQEVVITLVIVYWEECEPEEWGIDFTVSVPNGTDTISEDPISCITTVENLIIRGRAEVTLPYNEWGRCYGWLPEPFWTMDEVWIQEIYPSVAVPVSVSLGSYSETASVGTTVIGSSHDVQCSGSAEAVLEFWFDPDKRKLLSFGIRSSDSSASLYEYQMTFYPGDPLFEETTSGKGEGFDTESVHIALDSESLEVTMQDTYRLSMPQTTLVTLSRKENQ